MFYKAKDGNIFNLNEIVAISTLDGFREGYYTIMFKAAPSFAIDKEDYDNIIKHLKIVNVSARPCVYAEKRKLKLN